MAIVGTGGLRRSPAVLVFEASLILVIFNAGSFFGTTVYARPLPIMGVLLTVALTVWIGVASRILWGYGRAELGLQARGVSRGQWGIVAALMSLLYLAGFLSELFYPTEFEGKVTSDRLAVAAAFTLTFGPVFEELLFRGYLFRRIDDVFRGRLLGPSTVQVSLASLFNGLLFGLWHLPTPIMVLYFHDPLARIYAGLTGFVAAASLTGVLVAEMRRRTGSILPGGLLHFCANSIYILTMASRLLS